MILDLDATGETAIFVLINALYQMTSDTGINRPIAFICHDINGGLTLSHA